MDATRDALLLAPLLLERSMAGFCWVFSSVACRFPESFEDTLLLPLVLVLERRPWPVEFSPDDGSAPKSLAESRLRPPLLLIDRVRGLVGLSFLLERTSSLGFSSISDGCFLLPPPLLERLLPPRFSVLLEQDFVLCFSPELVVLGENGSYKLTFDVSTLVAAINGTPPVGGAVCCAGAKTAERSFDESKSSTKLLFRLFDTSEEERRRPWVLPEGRPFMAVVLFDRLLDLFLEVSGFTYGGSS
jgi:hypothetical protein